MKADGKRRVIGLTPIGTIDFKKTKEDLERGLKAWWFRLLKWLSRQ